MSATYVQAPFDENLDWKLAATMSPCHVKVSSLFFIPLLYVYRCSFHSRFMVDFAVLILFSLELLQVWKISFERFLHFLKSSQALSPGVALETAAVLQVHLFAQASDYLLSKF